MLLTKDGASTGNAALNDLHEPFSLLSSVAFLRPSPQAADSRYILQQLLSDPIQRQIQEAMSGNAITRLTLAKINKLAIPAAPLAEQRAIAAALSNADALIAALERLIAKKRDIKQGAMQELLTGKRRLPGFEETWKTRTLVDVFVPLRTASNSRADLVTDGGLGYLHYGDIHSHPSEHLDCSGGLLTYLRPGIAPNVPRMKDGDLVMADASEDTVGVGKAVEIKGLGRREAIAGLHTMLLRPKAGMVATGFAGYTPHIPDIRAGLVRSATGSSVYGVSKSALGNVAAAIPDRDEQAAIATILTDMDAEIAALEARLTKARDIKQGMMQQLLTGRIRLA